MNRVALLDVNVLVALFDPDHVHHETAHDWFAQNHAAGWATCPVTENGFVRVLSNPGYGAAVTRVADLVQRLRRFCATRAHRFWPDSVSLYDAAVFDPACLGGHRQVTDIYLLGLARKMQGRLATFDRTIPLKAVRGAEADTLAIIGQIEPD